MYSSLFVVNKCSDVMLLYMRYTDTVSTASAVSFSEVELSVLVSELRLLYALVSAFVFVLESAYATLRVNVGERAQKSIEIIEIDINKMMYLMSVLLACVEFDPII